MKPLARVHLVSIISGWCVSAFAQEKIAAVSFTDSLTFYDLTTWGFILLWAGIGSVIRFGSDYRAGLVKGAADVFIIVGSSMVAGFLGFVATELICQIFDYLPPSGAIGGIVLLAAYMNVRTYEILTDGMASFFQGVAKLFPTKGSGS